MLSKKRCAVLDCVQKNNRRTRVCDSHQVTHCSDCGAARVHDMWCSMGCNGVLTKCMIPICTKLKPKSLRLCRDHFNNRSYCRVCGDFNCAICHKCTYEVKYIVYKDRSGWCTYCWGPLIPCSRPACKNVRPEHLPLCYEHHRQTQVMVR